jgi:tRNA dimethylallyltransferase
MRRAVPHYLLDATAPDEAFNAGRYRELAAAAIEQVWREQRLPIVEGGSGLYIRALIDGLFNGPPADSQIRRRLRTLAEKQGTACLHRQLERVDPVSAARLHPNDAPRLIRALEVFELMGKPLSYWQKNTPPSPYQPLFFGLTAERSLLYQWIEERAERMLAQGLLEEVERLLKRGYGEELNSMQGLGYKQMVGYLKGRYDLEQALFLLKRDTRRYAKRQLTWFWQDKRIQWLPVSHPSQSDQFASTILSQAEQLQSPGDSS